MGPLFLYEEWTFAFQFNRFYCFEAALDKMNYFFSFSDLHLTESEIGTMNQLSQVVLLGTCIQEMPGSNPGLNNESN
jgi:hypothetical protein